MYAAVDLGSIGILEKETALEFKVVLRLDANRKAALIRDDRGGCPTVDELAGHTIVLWNRKLPIGTEHETVARIHKRKLRAWR